MRRDARECFEGLQLPAKVVGTTEFEQPIHGTFVIEGRRLGLLFDATQGGMNDDAILVKKRLHDEIVTSEKNGRIVNKMIKYRGTIFRRFCIILIAGEHRSR
jgi:hypothetical protein